MEKIKIKNSEGKNISAVIHRPKIISEKLAILCPGNVDSKDYDHLFQLAEALTKQGYTAVRFDPIGTWESDGEASEYSITQYLKDIKTVLEYMLEKENYKYILLGGHSRGGQLSILYAARDPRVSLVLGIMPPYENKKGKSREEWEKTGVRISLRDLPDNKNEKREFRLPFSYVLDRDKYDVIRDVKKIKAEIILFAGELDITVLPQEVKNIFDNANEPKKFIVLRGIGHGYRRNLREIEVVNKEILKALPL